MCRQTQRNLSLAMATAHMLTEETMRTLVFAQKLLAVALIGAAGPVAATVPQDLCPAAQDPCIVNTALTLTPGSVIDLGGRALPFGPAARVTGGAGQGPRLPRARVVVSRGRDTR